MTPSVPDKGGTDTHPGHGWMMLVGCVPMLIIVFALVAAHVISTGFLAYAGACLAMMFVMMRVMGRGGT
jgi:hypothetical protein